VNDAVVRRFYDAFARGDAVAMNACYAPDIEFSDPVFGELRGDLARAMWTMLCGGLRDFSLTYEVLESVGETVRGRAIATYLYSATGRNVRNEITGTFVCRDGAIVRQDDVFDLWKWSAQALGPAGMLLGWTPMMKKKIRTMATGRLEKFINRT